MVLWTRKVAGGLTDGRVDALVAAGCLKRVSIASGDLAREIYENRSLLDRQVQLGLFLTPFGRSILPCYSQGLDPRAAREVSLMAYAVALFEMAERPIWKADEGELWWQGDLVKRFRHDAADQRCVLDAFQRRGWPGCHDNPLPAHRGVNRKIQLRNTLKNLNRGQHPLRLRFHADGRGGVRWETLTDRWVT
jgi:hypothetical protein